jgi:sensor c-di-GMP phosphodiesterase-like protein
MQDATVMIERLKKLREKGVSVHIDDFGTGYSSLSYLHELPVDVLKIDKSFIEHLQQDSAIVQTILALAKQLHLKVVAEGVESEEQAYLLKRLDCDFM